MNKAQFDSAWLEGLTQFERARDAFNREFIAPLGDEIIADVLQTMTPGQHLALQQQDPALQQDLTSRLTGGNYYGRQG